MSREPENTLNEKVQAGSDLKDRVSDIATKVKDKANQVADTVAEKVGHARETTASYLQEHDFNQIGKDVMNVCRRYPAQTLIAAAAVGFLLGRARR
jgi:ElaB/YqjD/DUF883 family membrane-anchored ribosome-binding protein